MFLKGIYKANKRKIMHSKFVLESFQAYLEFSEKKINEGKEEFTLDLNFVKGYVDRLLQKQKEIASIKPPFSKFSKEKDPYDSWLSNFKSKNKGKEWPDVSNLNQYKFFGSFSAPYLWDKLTQEQKDAIYKQMLGLMKKSEYTKEKEFNKLIEEKKELNSKPYVAVIPSFVEIPPTSTPVPGKVTIIGIDGGVENKVFKDNRWGSGQDSASGKVNSDAFQDPVVLEGIKKEIDTFIKKFAAGKITKITSIEIESSASRYRNTNDKGGKAEGLSWGELSYNRAITILELFKESADANNLSKEKRKQIQEVTVINSKGTNGDGTSGPNPPAPIKFGYYDEKSKWVDSNGTFGNGKTPEKNRSTVIIAELGEGGKPTGRYTPLEDFPPVSPEKYADFRFVNFTIEAEEIDDEKPIIIKTEGKKEIKYTPAAGFPKTKPEKGPPKERRKRQVGKAGPGTNPFKCPEL